MGKSAHLLAPSFQKTPLSIIISSVVLAGVLGCQPALAQTATDVTSNTDTNWRFKTGTYNFADNLNFSFSDDKLGGVVISNYSPGTSTASPSQTINALGSLNIGMNNGTGLNTVGAYIERRSTTAQQQSLYVTGETLNLSGKNTADIRKLHYVAGLMMDGAGLYNPNTLSGAYAQFDNKDTYISAVVNPATLTSISSSGANLDHGSEAIFNGNATIDLKIGTNANSGGAVLSTAASHVEFNGTNTSLTGTSASPSVGSLYGAYVHGEYRGDLLYERQTNLLFNGENAGIDVTSSGNSDAYGIYAQGGYTTVTDKVKNFNVSAEVTGDSTNEVRTVYGIQSWHHEIVDIQAENTTISSRAEAKINSFNNSALFAWTNGNINIGGKKAVLTSSGTSNGGVTLYANGDPSNIDLADGVTGNAGTDITVNADNITITSSTTGTGEAIAAYAWQDGATIHVNSNAAGADQGKTVNVTGTIYAGAGGKSTFNFGNADSLFTGRTKYWPKDNDGSEVNIGLTNGARWNMTDKSWVTNFTAGGGHTYFGTDATHFATMTHDTSEFAPTALWVNNLKGDSGKFYLRADIEGNNADTLYVMQGEGAHKLYVRSHGAEPTKEAMDQYLVHAEQGDATFALGNTDGKVDAGLYLYELAQRKANNADGSLVADEWYLKRTDKHAPAAEDEAALAGISGQYALWHAQLIDLRTRLGEVRYGNAKDGLWVRGHVEKDRMDAPGEHNLVQDSYGASLGYDHLLRQQNGDQLFLGGNFRVAHADQRVTGNNGGKGNLNNYGLNLYATLAKTNGFYADAVLSADYYDQNTTTHMLDGSKVSANHSTYGLGASLEAGRKIHFNEDAMTGDYAFIEPQVQLSWYRVKGKDFTASNGMKIEQDDGDSLTGRLGLVLGKKFNQGKQGNDERYFQPYLKAGINHEFMGDQDVRINNVMFNGDLGGTRIYYGAGFDWQFGKDKRLYMQIDREEGSDFTREYHLSAGLRVTFD